MAVGKCSEAAMTKKRKQPKYGNPTVIRGMKMFIEKNNPTTQKEMTRRTKVSQPTVSRIISQKLDPKRLKKKTIKRLVADMKTKVGF